MELNVLVIKTVFFLSVIDVAFSDNYLFLYTIGNTYDSLELSRMTLDKDTYVPEIRFICAINLLNII